MKKCKRGHYHNDPKECQQCKLERSKKWKKDNPEKNLEHKQKYAEKKKESSSL